MKILILFLLLATPSFSQVVLENWGCDTIVAATNTNPVVFTCNTAHGFDTSHTSWSVRIYGATGNWKPINTQWNTNAVGSIQTTDTTITVVDAVPATVGDSIQLGFCNDAAYCGVEGTVTITAKDTTSNPHTITVTRSAPAFHYASAMYCGACGSSDPSIVYGLGRANTFTATYVSATQFSIPVNATSFGALTGTIQTRRTTGAGIPYGTDYTGANANVGSNSVVSGGVFTETLPAIPDPTNRKQVMMTVSGTAGFTNASRAMLGDGLICASGACTINLASPYPAPSSDLDRRLVPGSLVFLDGLADKRLEDGWLATSVNADQPTSFTISVPGIPDGPYIGRPALPTGTFSNGISSIVVNTNGSGVASAPITATTKTGAMVVTASAVGYPTVNFNLTNRVAGVVDMRGSLSTSPQSTAINTAFTNPLTVEMRTSGGFSDTSGIPVTFTSPASGASGLFSNGLHTITVTSDTTFSGTASATVTANGTGGVYNVTASAAGYVDVIFTLINTPLPAGTTSVPTSNTTPQVSLTNTAYATSLAVLVKNSGGTPVSGVPVTFTAPGIAVFNVAQRSTLNPDLQVQDSSQQWSFPMGYMQGYVKSGTWDPNTNRMYTWVRMNLDMQRRSNGGYEGTWGHYERIRGTNSNGGQYNEHLYDYFDNNWYSNQWVQVILNNHPTHQVGGGTWEMGNDPLLARGYIGNPGFLGDGSHMYDEMGRMYFSPAAKTVPDFVGVSASLAPITLGTVANEPDSSISSIHALWSPARFTQVDGCLGDGDASSGGIPPPCTGAKGGGAGFEVSWSAPQFDSMSYEVRRSATSMKTGAGFPAGLCNDGSTTCTSGNNDIVNWVASVYTITQWHSSSTSSTPPAGTTYIGIRPRFTVASVSGNGVSPIWIGTETPMDMTTGDLVTVSGVGGNTNANVSNVAITNQIDQQIWFLYEPVGTNICAMTGNGVNPTVITTCSAHGIANGARVKVNNPSNSGQLPNGNTAAGGVWIATVTDSTHLTIPVAGNGTYDPSAYSRVHGPGMLVSVVASSGTCTLTTSSAHNLLAGMKFTLVNSRNSTLGPAPDSVETLRTIASVPTSTTLTFACVGVSDGTYNTDPQTGDATCGNNGCFGVAQMTVRTNPAFAIAGTGNANWTSGGMVVSTEPNKNFTEIPFSIPNLGGGGGSPTASGASLGAGISSGPGVIVH